MPKLLETFTVQNLQDDQGWKKNLKFIPSWIALSFVLCFFMLLYAQIVNREYFISSWTELLCWSRFSFVVVLYSHCPKRYLIPSWTDLLCRFFLLLDTHIGHKGILFLHELTFYAYLDVLLLLLDTHIADKDILFHHELTFYADLDLLLLLLDTNIDHIGISFHHELTFYVDLDFLLLLLDTDIAGKDNLLLHERLLYVHWGYPYLTFVSHILCNHIFFFFLRENSFAVFDFALFIFTTIIDFWRSKTSLSWAEPSSALVSVR